MWGHVSIVLGVRGTQARVKATAANGAIMLTVPDNLSVWYPTLFDHRLFQTSACRQLRPALITAFRGANFRPIPLESGHEQLVVKIEN